MNISKEQMMSDAHWVVNRQLRSHQHFNREENREGLPCRTRCDEAHSSFAVIRSIQVQSVRSEQNTKTVSENMTSSQLHERSEMQICENSQWHKLLIYDPAQCV